MRDNTSLSHWKGSIPARWQVARTLRNMAAVLPPSSLPKNTQLFRPIATPPIARSVALLSISRALIVNAGGFPCSYEVFNGNRADVTTMEVILRMVKRKYGQARRIWVMDRGIVSEANLAAIRKREGQYLVGTPRSKIKEFESYLKEERAGAR